MTLQHLIAHAVRLGGGDLCADGHDWEAVGGRHCERCGGSQAVYQCARCGDWDYGEPGGPGWQDCQSTECENNRAEYREQIGHVEGS